MGVCCILILDILLGARWRRERIFPRWVLPLKYFFYQSSIFFYFGIGRGRFHFGHFTTLLYFGDWEKNNKTILDNFFLESDYLERWYYSIWTIFGQSLGWCSHHLNTHTHNKDRKATLPYASQDIRGRMPREGES